MSGFCRCRLVAEGLKAFPMDLESRQKSASYRAAATLFLTGAVTAFRRRVIDPVVHSPDPAVRLWMVLVGQTGLRLVQCSDKAEALGP